MFDFNAFVMICELCVLQRCVVLVLLHQVSAVMKLCHLYGLPVIPFGGGTSLEGQTLSPRTGVSIDFKNMKGCLDLNVKVNTLDLIKSRRINYSGFAS